MDNNSIDALEQRYQILSGDYQAGKIDEAVFIAEVDKLQFQDPRGRFWMIGAQSGAWHYYDGQNWQQADPRDAENLPFVDEQGRYWQRGVKSGDWYYYNPETKEWVKPSPSGDSRPVPVYGRGDSSAPRQPSSTAYPTQPQPYEQPSYSMGSDAPQFDGELFQDDEGRYWAIGAKTGQWYFYDHTGWHPAHEFQPTNPAPYQPAPPYQPQPPQPPVYPTQSYYAQPPQTFYQSPPDPWGQAYAAPPYQPSAPGYAYPPQQPVYQQPAPPPNYVTPPSQGYSAPPQPQMPPAEPAPQPASTESVAKMPAPPSGESSSGSWFFFDGKQWLQYSSGEPAATATPPKMVIDQESPATPEIKSAKPKAEAKSDPVIAEVIEEDESPVEVVEVEVITVIDPEPEPAPKVRVAVPKESATSTPLDRADEIEPRQPRRTSETMRVRPATGEPQRQGRDRMPTDPRLLGSGRKEGAHEPTVIIPTVSTTQVAAPVARATSKPMPVQPRRARENTVPMEPAPAQEAAAGTSPVDRRAMTQPMPQPSVAREARSETMPMPVQSVKKEVPQPTLGAVTPLTGQSAPLAQPQKEGHTLGDVLRSIPSTVWTFTGGIVALLIFAVLVIVGYSFFVSGNEAGLSGVAVSQSPTPTLDAGPPNATPTLGPTPTSSPEPATTPTAFSMATLSSPAVGITIDYPEGWKKKDDENLVVMSPSSDGLDPETLKDVMLWIGSPKDGKAEIKDLLAEVLSGFPANPKTLNEGTISIGSQTWTSTQIRFEDKNLKGEGIATIAVTNKDNKGYYLVAVAPADSWNSTQPIFQKMINSFRFGAKEPAVAQAATTPAKTVQATKASTATVQSAVVTSTTTLTASKESTATKTTPVAQAAKTTPTPVPTPTPKATATPLVYVVQQGDSLLAIANKFGVDVDTLAAKNDLDDPGKLSLGQELIIPFTPEQLAANSSQDSAAAAEATEASSKPAAEAEGTPGATASSEAEEAAATEEAPAPASAPAGVTGRIVYSAFNPGTDTFDLWLADVATGEQTGIASGASQPAFNKDGSLLAYRSWNLDTRGIFFRDFIGGRGGQVTKFVEDGLPTWSPDGFSFAFATRREGDRVPRIYKGDQNGKNDFSLNFQGEYVSTLPDGRLVVKGCLPSGDCGMFLMSGGGGGETKISNEQSDTAPMPSPDGKKIAFMSSGRGGSNWEIWVMDVNGANPKRLTDNGNNDGLPTWSPDGKSIAYVSDAGGVWAVWVMNADGSNQRKLFNMKGAPDGIVLRDRDNSKGWTEERISWAP